MAIALGCAALGCAALGCAAIAPAVRHWVCRLRAPPKTRILAGYPSQDYEWQDGRRYFLRESMARIDAVPIPEEVSPALLMAS